MANTTINFGGLAAPATTTGALQIEAGQYFFAIVGAFDGGTVSLRANVGEAVAVQVRDAVYTGENSDIIWLPDCTVFCDILGSGGSHDINIAMARVATDLT